MSSVLTEEEYETNERNAREYYAKERYQSLFEALREGVGNAYAAIQRANRDYGLPFEDGEILIRLVDGTLEIHDNGDGVSADDADNLRTVGESNSADDPFILASYGIGRFALMMLAEDDTFELTTRARADDSTYGVRFTMDRPVEIERSREDYGTTVRLELNDKVESGDIHQWAVEQFSFLPVTVELELDEEHAPRDAELDKNGIYHQTIGRRSFADTLMEDGNNRMGMPYKDENVELFFHSRYDTKRTGLVNPRKKPITLYNNMPVETPSARRGEKRFHFNILREDGAEVEGPHGGTVNLPQTTNDRGRLKEENYDEFVDWCNDIYDYYATKDLQTVEERVDSVQELIADPLYDFHKKKAQGAYQWDDPKTRAFMENRTKRLKSPRGWVSIQTIFERRDEYGEVYVGKTINERRKKVVQAMDKRTSVLSNEKRKYSSTRLTYDEAQELGFKLLKEVPLDRDSLEEMGIDEAVIEEVQEGSSSKYTVHYGSRDRYSYKRSRSDRSSASYRTPEDIVDATFGYVVLFSERGEENISDYYENLTPNVGAMNVSSNSVRGNLLEEYPDFFVHPDDVDWDAEVEAEHPVWLEDYDESIVAEIYSDYQLIDEMTPSFLIGLGRGSIYYIGDDFHNFEWNKLAKKVSKNKIKLERDFGDRSDEFKRDMLKVGSNSPVWEELSSQD